MKLIIHLLTAIEKLDELHILNSFVLSRLNEAKLWSLENWQLPANLKKLVLLGDADNVRSISFRFPKLTKIEIVNSESEFFGGDGMYSVLLEYVTIINDGSLKVSLFAFVVLNDLQ